MEIVYLAALLLVSSVSGITRDSENIITKFSRKAKSEEKKKKKKFFGKACMKLALKTTMT